jgi:DNA-binding CsgD family transcriptional regulator
MQDQRSKTTYGRLTGVATIPHTVSAVVRPARCRRSRYVASPSPLRTYPGLAAQKFVDAAPSAAPIERKPLQAQHDQVREICSQLRRPDVRLITLTGEPIDGKTRLVEGVAAELARDLVSGVVLVDLARVRQRSAIAQAVSEALRVGRAAPAMLNELLAWMRPKQIMLILENLERLQDGAVLVARLLEECPRLRVLLTSPLGLELDGEQTVEVGLVEQPAADEPIESSSGPATWRVLQHGDGGRPIVRRVSGWCLQPGMPPDPSRLAPLTNREQQVAQLLALGFSNKEIADELVITYRTAETHACRILRKLGFSCRGHVVQWAIERGLVVVASRQS